MILYIGLSGTMAAGKGLVKSMIEEKYKTLSFSLSDVLRDEATKRGVEINRKSLTDIGNELRKRYGPGVLADRVLQKLMKMQDGHEIVVIDSIRNPGEIFMLRTTLKKHFFLLFIDTDQKIRYKRTQIRKREGEIADSFEKFSEINKAELEGDDERGIQLEKCKRGSNQVIENNGTVEELREKVYDIIQKKIDLLKQEQGKRK